MWCERFNNVSHYYLARLSLADLLQETDEALPWLVAQLLPSGGFSLLAGKPKAGKSALAQCLALVVARGESFLGRADDQGPCDLFSAEGQASRNP
jgi:RecA-family ATPase